MRAIRVSATDVDALRFYLSPPIPEMQIELDALLRRLRREEPPTPEMAAGSAFHSALEKVEPGAYNGLSANGYTFSFQSDATLDLPAIREIKGTAEYAFDDVAVTLVGKVDAIHGNRVDDHKLTASFDAEKYLDSFQWKAYLEIFGATVFRWNVFEGRPTIEGGVDYLIRNIHPLTMYRYPGMDEDVERDLREFVLFARDHLTERFTAPIPTESMELVRMLRTG